MVKTISNKKKTHEEFLCELKIKNKFAYNELDFIGKYISNKSKILANSRYGKIAITPNNLLKGQNPTILSAINKHEYFLMMLKEKNIYAYNNLRFKTKYTSSREKITAMSKYGDIFVSPNKLLSGGLWDIRSAVDKTTYFYNELKDLNKDCYDMILELNSEFISNSKYIYFNTKYGQCRMTPNNMFAGKVPSIVSAINKDDYFFMQLKDCNKKIFDSIYKFENSYIAAKRKLVFNTKYGLCAMSPFSMLDKDNEISITSAIDKHQYFINHLKDVNPSAYEQILLFKTRYKLSNNPIVFSTIYGDCKMKPSTLLMGAKPSIMSAINPTEYWINMARELHGDRFDYSKFEFTLSKNKGIIICSKHGEFEQEANSHLRGVGCPICAKENGVGVYHKRCAKLNKDKLELIDGVVYLLSFYDDASMEKFYKIGITNDLQRRIYQMKRESNYVISILNSIDLNMYDAIFFESYLHNKNKKFKYKPRISFGGKNECFCEVSDEVMNIFNMQEKNKIGGGLSEYYVR